MGQKVHPTGLRLGVIYDWTGKWYAAGKNYAEVLKGDILIRNFLNKKFKHTGAISKVFIQRLTSQAQGVPDIVISTSKPGVIIGKKGEDIEKLRTELSRILNVNSVNLRIEEVKKPELDAKLVAELVAQQLARRIVFRRAMKRAVSSAMRAGAQGVKIYVGGRLGGAEIARGEWYREGRVPLHTFRADIDYATAMSHTTYGVIGVKVWIFKGEILKQNAKRGEKA